MSEDHAETAPLEPMEAQLIDALPAGDGWQYEPKWDGFRCLAVKQHGRVRLFAKSGKPLHRFFPEVVGALEAIAADDFTADGELIITAGAAPSFDALQARLHPAESRIRKLAAETPASLVLFDLPVGPGKVELTGETLAVRRKALGAFYSDNPSPLLRLSPTTTDRATAEAWLSQAGGGLDGIVAKRLADLYQPGKRAMLKIKNIRTADCVVGGFRYAAHSKLVGSLLLGLYDGAGRLDHVGFTSALGKEDKPTLTSRLEALRGEGFTGNAPGGPSRWSTEKTSEYFPLRHELVVEVSYDHVSSARFRHGTGIVRWRLDKAPRQCTYAQLGLDAAASPVIARTLG
jgi:ATP-dependent DNA ligase